MFAILWGGARLFSAKFLAKSFGFMVGCGAFAGPLRGGLRPFARSPRGIDLDGVGVAWSPRGVGIAVALPDGVGVVRSLCRHGIGAVAGPLSTKRCSLHHRRIRERICAECLRPFAGSPRGIDLDGVGVAWSPRGVGIAVAG